MKAELKKSHRGKRGVFVTIRKKRKGKIRRKTYRLAAVLKRRERDIIDREVRDDESIKAQWRRACFLSRDMPNSKAARADYSDGGRFVSRMVARLDGPKPKLSENERNRAIVNAAVYLANTLGYRYQSPEYLEILSIISAIAIFGRGAREELMKRFNLTYNAYTKRIEKYTKMLENRRKRGGV